MGSHCYLMHICKVQADQPMPDMIGYCVREAAILVRNVVT